MQSETRGGSKPRSRRHALFGFAATKLIAIGGLALAHQFKLGPPRFKRLGERDVLVVQQPRGAAPVHSH